MGQLPHGSIKLVERKEEVENLNFQNLWHM